MKRKTVLIAVLALAALCGPILFSTDTRASSGSSSMAGRQVVDGRTVVTASGTPVVLTSQGGIVSIVITASEGNSGTIVIGASTVVASLSTRRGTPLSPGEKLTISADPSVSIVNGSLFYVDSTADGDVITWTAVTYK